MKVVNSMKYENYLYKTTRTNYETFFLFLFLKVKQQQFCYVKEIALLLCFKESNFNVVDPLKK